MDSIWNVAPQIGTGLSLVAFVVAVGLYAYRARLKQRASVIAKMPARDRLAAIDATAEFLRVDVSGLSDKDKHDIVVRQLAIRARRELMLAGIAVAVALLLGAVAIISIVADNPLSPLPVAQKCYRFDPQSGEPNKSLGERPCFPGKLVYLKYWDPNNYDPSWPSDRPNRVFQAKGTTGDGHMRWSEQDLTHVTNKLETWGTQNHDWVTVLEDMGIGGGLSGLVLRRIDLEPIPVGGDKNQCESEGGKRDVLEFAFPRDILTQLSSGNAPTVRMRWVRVSCSQEIGSNPLVGPAFIDTRWPIVAAVTDPT
jgi:hypothetical protein